VGYALAAFLAGWLARGRTAGFRLMALLAASAAIYVVGALQLATYVGWSRVFWVGVLPFVPGDILKALAISSACKKR